MSSSFPIEIGGAKFDTPEALAADMARRARDLDLPDRASGHPADFHVRFMRDDRSGRVRSAVQEASRLLLADLTDGDVLDYVGEANGPEAPDDIALGILGRVESGRLTNGEWFGDARTISDRALQRLASAFKTRLQGEADRFCRALVAVGNFYEAAFVHLALPAPAPGLLDVVAAWAASGVMKADEIASIATWVGFYPGLPGEVAGAMARAPRAAKDAWLEALRRDAPHTVDDALVAALQLDAPPPSAPSLWNHCQGQGLLAGAATPIPEDQQDFYARGLLHLVPCNHLLCSRCGEVVREIAGKVVRDGVDLGALYGEREWLRSKRLEASEGASRLYACRCTEANITANALVATLAAREDLADLPWSCGGHPTVRDHLDLDGVRIDEDTDLDTLVARALSGHAVGGKQRPWATHGAIWVLRLFGRLQGHPLQASVSLAVARGLLHREPRVRAEALIFFLQNPRAAGSEGLVELAKTRQDLFVDVQGPDSREGETLEFQLLRVLGTRLHLDRRDRRDDEQGVLELLQRATLRPGLAGATLPTLTEHDLDWVLAHRLEIGASGHANAMALSLWIGNRAPEHEEETDALLIEAGHLSEDDL